MRSTDAKSQIRYSPVGFLTQYQLLSRTDCSRFVVKKKVTRAQGFSQNFGFIVLIFFQYFIIVDN